MIPYILLAVAVLSLLLLLVLLFSVFKGGNAKSALDTLERENAEQKTEIKKISAQISESDKKTADDFLRNRMEITNQLNVMQEKLAAITKSNLEERLALNESVHKALLEIREVTIVQNEKQSKAMENAISKMQESNEKKLEEMRMTVDEKLTSTLTERLNSSFKTVSEQLENVYKSLGEMKELSLGVTDNVGALNRVLTNVKARGTWAEIQLEGILDQTIPNMYDKNVATGDKDSERVEFAVRIPESDDKSKFIYLPIDSKFPMEDYVRLCTAAEEANPEAVKAAKKALESRVYDEAKMIRKYISVPKTTPFAILYLATEGLYAEIVSSQSGILEKIQNECNIMIAGPSTITALLNSLAMGFKTIAINEKANEVRLLLGAAKAQYEKFGIVLEKAKKKIDDASKALDDAQKRNDIIHKKLKNVEVLDEAESGSMLELPQFENSED